MARFTLDIAEQDIPYEYGLLFAGQKAAHNYAVYHLISEVLLHRRVESIIEFGTAAGALTMYLGLWGLRLKVPVWTFERDVNLYRDVRGVLHDLKVHCVEADIFHPTTEAKVKEICAGRPTYLICDGGDKIREFDVYSQLVPVGSTISIHDWQHEFYENNLGAVPIERFQPEVWAWHDARLATVVKLGEREEA